MLENSFNIFSIMAVIIPILVICIFVFTFAMMFSPKLRAKIMSTGDIYINSTRNIISGNENELKDIVEKGSVLGSIAVEKTARAIKNGSKDNMVYCKYCGKVIGSDSRFCKNCGKEV